VALSRRRYRCGACAAEVVPLDEALGLAPRTQHTLGVRERALFLVTELSDAKTARTLAAIRWIRERSFPAAVELLDWYHLRAAALRHRPTA
jgi:hypothetical protein